MRGITRAQRGLGNKKPRRFVNRRGRLTRHRSHEPGLPAQGGKRGVRCTHRIRRSSAGGVPRVAKKKVLSNHEFALRIVSSAPQAGGASAPKGGPAAGTASVPALTLWQGGRGELCAGPAAAKKSG